LGNLPANYVTMNRRARIRRIGLDGKAAQEQMSRIFVRDKGICQLCYQPCSRADATRDHIKPFYLCNRHEARSDDNVRLAHKKCNNDRGLQTDPGPTWRPKIPAPQPKVVRPTPPTITFNIGTLFPQLGNMFPQIGDILEDE
jgi:5-methylcytosine-specific restriction endonuclease McrA